MLCTCSSAGTHLYINIKRMVMAGVEVHAMFVVIDS